MPLCGNGGAEGQGKKGTRGRHRSHNHCYQDKGEGQRGTVCLLTSEGRGEANILANQAQFRLLLHRGRLSRDQSHPSRPGRKPCRSPGCLVGILRSGELAPSSGRKPGEGRGGGFTYQLVHRCVVTVGAEASTPPSMGPTQGGRVGDLSI